MDGRNIAEIGLWVEQVKGSARMPESHRHAEVEVNFIAEGSLTYWLRGGVRSLEAGSLSAFWAAYPHRVVADDENLEFFWMTIPLAAFLSWHFPQSLVEALMSGSLVRQEKVSSLPAERSLWETWARDFRRGVRGGFSLDVLRWEARARLGRFALEATVLEPEKTSARGSGMSRGVEKMMRYIGEHFCEPVKVADIAASAGLNPNYATEAFRKAFGLGIKDYLNRQRIAEAQRLLLSGDDTVLQIGHESGFASPSRFHEWFQRLCGTSPEQYRKLYAE